MKVMKHEWHSVDSQWTFEITEDFIGEVYPELEEDEIKQKMSDLSSGELSVSEIMDDAWNANVDIDWDHKYDDWWTSREGGYAVTYDLIEGDEE